jgi:hypothetical protein
MPAKAWILKSLDNPLLLNKIYENLVCSMRPLKNVQFCLSSRKAKILNAGIH